MSNVIEIKTTEEFENLINNDQEGVVMVDFWAEWCGPCKMFLPIIDQIAKDFDKKAFVAKVNVDELKDIATKYNIRSIPTVLFFKNGEQVDINVGAVAKVVLYNKLNNII